METVAESLVTKNIPGSQRFQELNSLIQHKQFQRMEREKRRPSFFVLAQRRVTVIDKDSNEKGKLST